MKNLIPFALLLSVCFIGCKDDDDEPELPEIPNEEEVITTLTYTLTPNGGGDVKVFSFEDLDGDGGNAPVITTDSLERNTMYSGSIQVLNKVANPVENITEEVEEEGDEHQFFFQTTNNQFNIQYADMDENDLPLGLKTNFTTDSTSGSLVITLRHEPNKTAANVAEGNIANAGGETDIEVTFTVNVK